HSAPWILHISLLIGCRGPMRRTVFPYTTLFRSLGEVLAQAIGVVDRGPRAARGGEQGAAGLAEAAAALAHPQHGGQLHAVEQVEDRKSTRLNSSHVKISYAVFCLKKKNRQTRPA